MIIAIKENTNIAKYFPISIDKRFAFVDNNASKVFLSLSPAITSTANGTPAVTIIITNYIGTIIAIISFDFFPLLF